MRSITVKSRPVTCPVKRSHRRSAQEAIATSPRIAFVRQVCDTFIELRRERAFLGTSELIGGFATIGNHSVLIIIQSKDGKRGSRRSLVPDGARVSGYRKARHLLQLANKFSRPVIVFLTSPSSVPGKGIAAPWNALELTKHIVSQWHLGVPMILVVLSRRTSADIFGAWLADKVLSLEQTRFSMNMLDQGKRRQFHVGASELLRDGIVDTTIPAPLNRGSHGQAVMLYRLKAALIQVLDEVSYLSGRELIIRRRAKLARVEAVLVKLCGLSSGSGGCGHGL